MLKIDNNFIQSIKNLIETSEKSKKFSIPLTNRILKLVEEVGELSQAYLKYFGDVNASKSGDGTKEHLIEEAQDVLLVIIDILNQIIETEKDQKKLIEISNIKNKKWLSKLKINLQ